jgi:hypothetical protein
MLQPTERCQAVSSPSITEIEHPPCYPDLAPNDFWLFPEITSALKGRRFQDIEGIQKNVTVTLKAIPQQEFHTFPAVATSLGKVHSY